MFALIDCNNFYASCERLFRPDLRYKPILVLSNNDGCVIARSNEAKALGIAMGVPYFKVKALCQRAGVHVFSSNFALYGDLSHRVMTTIEQEWPEVEIYSIDEAFLNLSSLPIERHEAFCADLQRKILKDTGIPTSIGMGKSKTLAKAANYLCKKTLKVPTFNLVHADAWLKQIPIEEVWGVGRKWSKKFIQQGIYTAYDLSVMDINLLKMRFNVMIIRTAMELRGISCGDFGRDESRQSILSSKSFGSLQSEYAAVAESLSSHCARAVEKLREQNSLVQQMSVFVQTNRFRDDLAQHFQSIELRFPYPTDDVRTITHLAKQGLLRIFKAGHYYKKTGVCLELLLPKASAQMDLFHQPSEESLQKSEDLMLVLDKINRRFGRHTLHLAAEGSTKPWDSRMQLRSPRYTTQWSELLKVNNGT